MGKKRIVVNVILLIIGFALKAQTADFSADVTTGCDTLTVQFSDQSTGATSWEWDFGDGTTSNQQTPPPHFYSATGQYNVSLTINGATNETKNNFISVIPKPDATYSQKDTIDIYNYVFTNVTQLSEAIFDYDRLWQISDGAGYFGNNIQHTFSDTGTYQVQLIVSADLLPQCRSTLSKDIVVEIPVTSSANFSADTLIGCDTLVVQFTDLSSGATSWEWDFGDETTSTEQTPPPHLYLAGQYTVTLSINGSEFERKEDYINVIPRPDPNFWLSDTSILGSYNYVFRNIIQDAEATFDYNRLWEFSDGPTYTTRSVLHTFPDTGLYRVQLTISADLLPQCSSTLEQRVRVRDEIYVPNVFSPEGDNINDLYIIEYNGITNLSIYIYSRFGNLVHKSTAPIIVWDGIGLNGQEMNEGVYYYVLTSDDGEISKTGFIHLYR